MQLITGPREHWYLSFDLPLNSVNQAKIASDNTVQPKDEPTQVYLGLNWRIGDLFTTYSGRAFAQNLVFKGILLATKHPLDSWGFELGLRGDFWKAFGIDLSAFAPFVGYTFTKEDAKTAGVLVPNGRRNSKLRGGISFNIDKGITWLKGSISGKAPAKGESAK